MTLCKYWYPRICTVPECTEQSQLKLSNHLSSAHPKLTLAARRDYLMCEIVAEASTKEQDKSGERTADTTT